MIRLSIWPISGVGNGEYARLFGGTVAAAPVVIMFSPTGQMSEVYSDNNSVPFDSVYLLIGRRSKVLVGNPTETQFADATASNFMNLMDTTNLWVAINSRTVRNCDDRQCRHQIVGAPPAPPPPKNSDDARIEARIKAARESARSSVQKGGR